MSPHILVRPKQIRQISVLLIWLSNPSTLYPSNSNSQVQHSTSATPIPLNNRQHRLEKLYKALTENYSGIQIPLLAVYTVLRLLNWNLPGYYAGIMVGILAPLIAMGGGTAYLRFISNAISPTEFSSITGLC